MEHENHLARGGSLETVICMHSSGNSARQWEALKVRLGTRYRVLAPEFHGHGAGPRSRELGRRALAEDARLVEPLIAAAPGGVHLVGHSYGGAVALRLALRHRLKVRSLALFEPVAFRLLLDAAPAHLATAEICRVALGIGRGVAAGDLAAAGRRFVDYWSEQGAWEQLAPWHQQSVAQRMPVVRGHFDALLASPDRLSDYASLDLPVLLISGEATRAPARRITELLAGVLPRAEARSLAGVGHLGAVTHPEAVNHLILEFIDRQRRAARLDPARARIAA